MKSLVLYHGTDARMLAMTREERSAFMSSVDIAITAMWQVYQPYFSNMVQSEIVLPWGAKGYVMVREFERFKDCFDNPNDYNNLCEALMMQEARVNGSSDYQYGSLYLTGSWNKASRYAYRAFAGGEIGLLAYRMIKALEVLKLSKWNPDSEVLLAINRVLAFAEAETGPTPAVVTIDGVSFRDLLTEKGMPLQTELSDEIISVMSFRYLPSIDLSLYKVCSLS